MHKNKQGKVLYAAFKKAARSMKMKRAIQLRRIVSHAIYPEYCYACGKPLIFTRDNPEGDKLIPFLCEKKDDRIRNLAHMLYRAFVVVATFYDKDDQKWSGIYDMVCPECITKELLKILEQEDADGKSA